MNRQQDSWWNKKEKAGIFLLRLTLYMVTYLPAFILKFIMVIITFLYYIFSRDERKSIAVYRRNLRLYFKEKVDDKLAKTSVFGNFLSFSESICDKFAVWKGKIEYKDLVFANGEYLHNELSFGIGNANKKGQIILVSHFGNVEVLRAIGRHIKETKIAVLVYKKHNKAFADIINEISQTDLIVYNVEDLSLDKMLELSDLLKNGCHICIMADRVSEHSKKNIKVKFLGLDCFFPAGAFILAGLLKSPVTTLWCEKYKGKYRIELEKITDRIILSRDKETSIKPYVEKYISIFENHIKNNPSQWFNFYNFWQDEI